MSELATTSEQLPFFKGEEYEDHVNAWLEVDKDVQNRYWMLGAIAASLDKKYGKDVFGKFGSDVGSSRTRIREYAATYRAWENNDRSSLLSFKHHTIAGRHSEPQKAIEAAEDEQLSTRELDKFVKTGELPDRNQVQETEEVEDVDPMEMMRIVRTLKMEYVVEYADGKTHPVTKQALLDAGFPECSCCAGRGMERVKGAKKRHHKV